MSVVLPVFYSKISNQCVPVFYFHDVLKVDAKDKIKLLNFWFVANKLSLSLDKTCYSTGNLPGLYAGPGFY